MQLVIDIDDKLYQMCKDLHGDADCIETIINGIPLTDILDKIRAEIEDIAFDWQEIDGEHESFMVVDLNDVLQIIDKYKAESEELGRA